MGVAPFTPGISQFELTSDVLTIGNVTFMDEEHPEELEFGLDQSLAVHQLIGGTRVVQPLGPNPKDVTWTGHLFEANIKERLADLKAMEVAGNSQNLAYLDQKYLVVIKSFTPKYHSSVYAEYSITVTVVADLSGNYNQGSGPSSSQQINGVTQAAQVEINKLVVVDQMGTVRILSTFNILFAALEVAGLVF